MLFETLKNSLRAVVETPGQDKQEPEFLVTKVIEVEVTVNITIEVSDEREGIPLNAILLIWTYMYTTVDRVPSQVVRWGMTRINILIADEEHSLLQGFRC
ncbi:hypothetical protein F5883DRAFT_73850 [Diaporthe sp. PMI_573]|jgi:pyruvate dehydrogenase kinase 2/3/4|nr:hypothetical protein F5883DRAFT_73850 [Diaporthaceae sp. PMI_573]